METATTPAKRQISFFIPKVGTRLTLTEDWSFGLHNEDRNKSMLDAIGYEGRCGWASEEDAARTPQWRLNPDEIVKVVEGVTLPVGTTLVVSRVYVRSGKSASFDSITFKVEKGCPDPRFDKCRFWVKLREANKIQCEVSELWL